MIGWFQTPVRDLLAVAICLAPAIVDAAPARVEISLRPEVTAEHAQVTLADVAALSTKDTELRERLANIPLGSVPRTGRDVRLDREQVMRWIRAQLGPAADISWTGARESRIRLGVRELPGADVAAQVVEAVRAAFARAGKRVEIAVSSPPPGIRSAAGRVDIAIRPLPDTAALARHLVVWADISVDGRFVRTVPVRLDVKVFAPALVATRDQAAGEVIDPSGVIVREVEWSGHDAFPVLPERSAHLRLRKRIAAGETLTRAHVERAPEVWRGQWATLRSHQGAVELETRAEVLQDGFPGQPVRVKLENATSAIMAYVSGPGVVEVRP